MSWPERIEGEDFVLRPWRAVDADSLAFHANDAQVACWLDDRFPYPYTTDDAQAFLAHALSTEHEIIRAIERNGEACGCVGIRPGEGVARRTAEIGYWLGRAYWGEGIATAALRALIPHALRELELHRLQARVFDGNEASMRLLERCGFVHEAVLKHAAMKHGKLLGMHIYAITRDTLDAAP